MKRKSPSARSSTKKSIKADPFYARESKKYEKPIASREFIISTLEDINQPARFELVAKKLKIKSDPELNALNYRLKAMIRDGQIILDRKGRYCLLDKIILKKGQIIAHPDGYGFFTPDRHEESHVNSHHKSHDLIVSLKEMKSVMHGDIVLAYETGVDRRGRTTCKIHEVLEHVNTRIVGRFVESEGAFFVSPDNKRLSHDIVIPQDKTNLAKNGQIVLVEVLSFPSKHHDAVGQVVQILGNHLAPGLEIKVAILSHHIREEWPDEVEQALTHVPYEVTDEDIKSRTDLRLLPFVTIDGEDAKDFDDAVFCKIKPRGGFQLYVAIADVSHYIKKDDPLDLEAKRRGNSVYFPEYVVPMLPEVLSNGICSLKPKEDRLCMVMEISVSSDGAIQRYRVYRGVIHSQARLTYTQVGKWLSDPEQHASCKKTCNEAVLQNLLALSTLHEQFQDKRKKRGALDFNTSETQIVFDENRKIDQIKPIIRNDAHRLIEECMLAANVCAARFLKQTKIPMLYRGHTPPDEDKIAGLKLFLGEFGLKLKGGDKPTSKDFQDTLRAASELPEQHLIETVMLRALKQAQYVESTKQHFGLAYPAYTHFTSPIRRYPDLLIHRAINHILDHHSNESFEYTKEDMATHGEHCSQTERRADEATRDVVNWLKCEFMQNKLGEIFKGKISSVTGFGVFVLLDDIFVEGLVHVTSLNSDYYQFDAIKHRLTGTRSGRSFRIGDPMTVQVARVDLDERKIDFQMIE